MKDFEELVYDYVKLVPLGKVTTFKEIARACGSEKYINKVVKILNSEKTPEDVPLYRVVSCKGEIKNNRSEKKKMLEFEGVEVKGNKVDLLKYGFYLW